MFLYFAGVNWPDDQLHMTVLIFYFISCLYPSVPCLQEFTAQMVSYMWEPLVAAVKKEPEPELAAAMLDSLAEIVDLAEPGQLSGPQVEAAFAAFSAILSAAEARRSQRSKVGFRVRDRLLRLAHQLCIVCAGL
jgi:hypothetical protein